MYKNKDLFLIQQAKFHVQPRILSSVFPGLSSCPVSGCSSIDSSRGDWLWLCLLQPPKRKRTGGPRRRRKFLSKSMGKTKRLKYKAYSSPKWQEVAKELRSGCLKQHVSCDNTPKQCKDKLANLKKKIQNREG